MIQVRCANCSSLLRARDQLAGKAVACPHCNFRVDIPVAGAGFEVIEDNAPAPARRPPQAASSQRPPARPARVTSVDDEEFEDRPRRPVRRRKRRPAGGMANDRFVIICGSLLIVGIVLGVLGFASLGIALLAMSFCAGVFLFSGIWGVVVAFQEDASCGLMYLFVPFYSLYYLVTRWETAGRPFLLGLTAIIPYILVIFALEKHEDQIDQMDRRPRPGPVRRW